MPVTLPFGRYRSIPLESVPVPYLRWVVGVVTAPALRDAIELQLASRLGMHRDPPPTAAVNPALATAIVRAGLRTVAAHQRVGLDDPALAAAGDFLFVCISRGLP